MNDALAGRVLGRGVRGDRRARSDQPEPAPRDLEPLGRTAGLRAAALYEPAEEIPRGPHGLAKKLRRDPRARIATQGASAPRRLSLGEIADFWLNGDVWNVRFWYRGRRYERSTQRRELADAKRWLRERLAEIDCVG